MISIKKNTFDCICWLKRMAWIRIRSDWELPIGARCVFHTKRYRYWMLIKPPPARFSKAKRSQHKKLIEKAKKTLLPVSYMHSILSANGYTDEQMHRPCRSSIDAINDVRIKLECYVNFVLRIVFARRESPLHPYCLSKLSLRVHRWISSMSVYQTAFVLSSNYEPWQETVVVTICLNQNLWVKRFGNNNKSFTPKGPLSKHIVAVWRALDQKQLWEERLIKKQYVLAAITSKAATVAYLA